MRIEDLDRPRAVPGAAESILVALAAYGLEWDGPVHYQSTRNDAYATALQRLTAGGWAYPCACSRREVAAAGQPGAEGAIYPGTCRRGLPDDRPARAWRVATDPAPIVFTDRIRGSRSQVLTTAVGDFIIRRADGIFAYQLAVVVDDIDQDITHVVRGADLLGSTPRQIFLQRLLGGATPAYAHVPLVLDSAGRKLSKSDAAAPLDPDDPIPDLLNAWGFLGQVPFEERPGSVAELLAEAVTRWDVARVGREANCHPAGEVSAPGRASVRG